MGGGANIRNVSRFRYFYIGCFNYIIIVLENLFVDVKKIAGDLVLRWKKLISEPTKANSSQSLKKVGSTKRKTVHPSTDAAKKLVKIAVEQQHSIPVKQDTVSGAEDHDSEDHLAVSAASKTVGTAEKQNKSVATTSSSAQQKCNKLTEFNLFEKLDEERSKEKKKRPKTVKTFMSKFRSTGELLFQYFSYNNTMFTWSFVAFFYGSSCTTISTCFHTLRCL